MQAEKERQMEMDNVDAVDSGEERLRDEQIAEDQEQMEGRVPAISANEEDYSPLFENNEAVKFRTQWLEIQSRFVDDPRVAVKEADDLVADVIKNITRTFSDERMTLENQWKSGDRVSTEDLRVALQRYRSFFNRLLKL
jgi:Lon protease-like protein